MEYINKENYITRDPDPIIWKNHANYFVMKSYQQYIKGKCGDLGCNHGSCTLLMLDFKPESIHGFDINIDALKVAYNTALLLNIQIPISFMETNLTNIQIEDNYFDFLMSFHTLEHIFPIDTDLVIKEIYRILKYGGYFAISIPYDHSYPDPCHVNFFKEDTLKLLFEDNNFITIECFEDNRWPEKNLLTGLFQKPLDLIL